MSVDESTVREMAALARLAVSDEQLPAVAKEMDTILSFMAQIGDFDGTDDCDPPPAVRRSDEPRSSTETVDFQGEHLDASGAMTVPPIKGAS